MSETESEYQRRQEALLEPTDRELAMAEEHVAYEGTLAYLKWQETSAHGFKITFGLESRAELDPFDGVMTIRSKRGGQRYMAVVQPHWQPDGPGTPEKPDASQQFTDEWLFAGRGWSESAGAHIAVQLADRKAIAAWKLRQAGDQITDDSGPRKYFVMLFELDDDEQIVNQEKRQRVIPLEEQHGGPKSKKVAMLCQDPDFIEWLSRHSIHAEWNVEQQRHNEYTAVGADLRIKNVCGITTKKAFDLDGGISWERFETQFNRPFLHWLQRRGR